MRKSLFGRLTNRTGFVTRARSHRTYGRATVRAGRLLLSVVALATVVALSNNVKPVAAASKGLTISPATQNIDLKNGQEYSGEMNVENGTNADMKVKFTTGSYSIINNDYSAPNYDKASKYSALRDWIKLDQSTATLKPGESIAVKYTVHTPKNPPAGTQYATVFAETVPTKQVTSGIVATSRVGMVLSARMVDGKTLDKATIQNQKISWYQQSQPMVAAFDIKNEGNVGASVSYTMKVSNAMTGKEVYKASEDSNTVYPETTRTFKGEWDKMGIGFYNVALDISINGRNHTITQWVCTIPLWIIIIVLLLIAAAIAYGVFTFRMRCGKKGSPERAAWNAKRAEKKAARAKRRSEALAKAKAPAEPTYSVHTNLDKDKKTPRKLSGKIANIPKPSRFTRRHGNKK